MTSRMAMIHHPPSMAASSMSIDITNGDSGSPRLLPPPLLRIGAHQSRYRHQQQQQQNQEQLSIKDSVVARLLLDRNRPPMFNVLQQQQQQPPAGPRNCQPSVATSSAETENPDTGGRPVGRDDRPLQFHQHPQQQQQQQHRSSSAVDSTGEWKSPSTSVISPTTARDVDIVDKSTAMRGGTPPTMTSSTRVGGSSSSCSSKSDVVSPDSRRLLRPSGDDHEDDDALRSLLLPASSASSGSGYDVTTTTMSATTATTSSVRALLLQHQRGKTATPSVSGDVIAPAGCCTTSDEMNARRSFPVVTSLASTTAYGELRSAVAAAAAVSGGSSVTADCWLDYYSNWARKRSFGATQSGSTSSPPINRNSNQHDEQFPPEFFRRRLPPTHDIVSHDVTTSSTTTADAANADSTRTTTSLVVSDAVFKSEPLDDETISYPDAAADDNCERPAACAVGAANVADEATWPNSKSQRVFSTTTGIVAASESATAHHVDPTSLGRADLPTAGNKSKISTTMTAGTSCSSSARVNVSYSADVGNISGRTVDSFLLERLRAPSPLGIGHCRHHQLSSYVGDGGRGVDRHSSDVCATPPRRHDELATTDHSGSGGVAAGSTMTKTSWPRTTPTTLSNGEAPRLSVCEKSSSSTFWTTRTSPLSQQAPETKTTTNVDCSPAVLDICGSSSAVEVKSELFYDRAIATGSSSSPRSQLPPSAVEMALRRLPRKRFRYDASFTDRDDAAAVSVVGSGDRQDGNTAGIYAATTMTTKICAAGDNYNGSDQPLDFRRKRKTSIDVGIQCDMTSSLIVRLGRPASMMTTTSDDFNDVDVHRFSSTSDPVDDGAWCRPCGIWFSDAVLHSIHAGCHAVVVPGCGGGAGGGVEGGGDRHPFSCNVCGRRCADRYAFNTHLVRGHDVAAASARRVDAAADGGVGNAAAEDDDEDVVGLLPFPPPPYPTTERFDRLSVWHQLRRWSGDVVDRRSTSTPEVIRHMRRQKNNSISGRIDDVDGFKFQTVNDRPEIGHGQSVGSRRCRALTDSGTSR